MVRTDDFRLILAVVTFALLFRQQQLLPSIATYTGRLEHGLEDELQQGLQHWFNLSQAWWRWLVVLPGRHFGALRGPKRLEGNHNLKGSGRPNSSG